MKLFKRKEEKNKVGRPKLADDETKKKAIISVCVALVLVITLALTGAFKLNIIKFNKLKGTVNVNLCSEIPAKYQPKSETNPEGTYDYGFTDPKFYSAVVSTYNEDASYCSTISEEQLNSITSLSANSRTIDNADGLQYLTGLQSLSLSGNFGAEGKGNLININLSQNVALTYLRLEYNKLTDIDVSQNLELRTLNLARNNINSIDLGQNVALTSLDLAANNLTGINLSQNTALTALYLGSNKLSDIDLSQNASLTSLSLGFNNLSEIDVSQNTALESLLLSNNNLSSIDLSKNTALKWLELSGNNLGNIDISNNIFLERLNLSDINLTSLDLSKYKALTNLNLSRNNLSSIDVSQNTALTSLSLGFNNLSEIDVSQNTALESLLLSNNNLEKIDVSNNTLLRIFDASSNKIEKTYATTDKSITIENPNIITLYPNDITYSFSNNNVATYNNGTLERIKPGNTKLYINQKISDSLAYETTYTIDFIGINSFIYLVNLDDKTIDLKGTLLSEVNANNLLTNSQNYSLVINGDKVEVKDVYGNVVETYILKNYKLFRLESSLYTIDEDKKEIDSNGAILSSIYASKFSVTPSSYKLNKNNNKLEIKDSSGNIIDTYTFKNYIPYKLTSTYYTINEEEKTIDIKEDLLSNVSTWKFNLGTSDYKMNVNNNKLEIKDSEGSIIDTYKFTNYVLYKLTSSYYTIDNENKTIDVNKDLLNYVSTYRFSINPTSYKLNVNDNKLEIKDSEGSIIDTYKFTNYVLYKLTSSYCTIDSENKTIDAKEEVLNSVQWRINITPYNYTRTVNGNKLEVKDAEGNIIDIYKIINYLDYKITSSNYTISYKDKTIDVKNNIFSKNNVWINPSDQYELRRNGDKIEILNSDKEVVDSYDIINEREKIEDAYLKAGFKDENLYAWVVALTVGIDNFEEVPMYKKYLLTEEEMQNIESLGIVNQDITDTTGIERLTNLNGIYLFNTNINSIDLSKYPNLNTLIIRNGKLTSLDVSKNPDLQYIDVAYNNISKITGLEELEQLGVLIAYNNNLTNLDISKATNLEALMISNNPFSNTLYMLRGKEIDYKKDFKLNEAYEIKYDVVDTNVISYKNSKLKAIKEGITNIYLSTESMIYNYKSDFWDKSMACEYLMDQKVCEELENINEEEVLLPYLINQEIKVYDITSDTYKVDKDKKIIDALNKDFDASLINITLNGLTGTLENDKFIIKDGETVVDTYIVKNIKQVVKEEIVSDSKNGTNIKSSDKVIKKLEERKEKAEEKLEDIVIESEKVPLATLILVKGTDSNIIVKNDGITITINGKDIDKVNGNLDLSYELKVLKESLIYNEVKDKVTSGMVLSLNNKEIPYKMLIEIEVTDKVEKEIGRKNLYLYNYNNDKYSLIAENISSYNDKISFYINKQGNYILTNNKIEDKSVKTDKSIIEDNTKLIKEINYKKIIIPIIIFILLIILGIIGYVRYKKNKGKND